MKTFLCRFPLLFAFALFLVTCQAPVSNKSQATPDVTVNNWLEEITIADLQKGYEEKKFSIEDVVKAYMERIEAIDKNGPKLNSIIVVNPDAIVIARELDKELASGKKRGPLHGIPVILKDNIDTHDKMPTTAGSLALKDSYPSKDSYVAMKLREAGAIILGKANLSEWANFRALASSSGWSGVGGQTKNPYVLDRNPCGSSSGSGVSVSANLCAAAIGTETNGSIVCPSNNNGIVGIKPTVGLISRSGVVPISFTQDTPGPMCRTVEDAAILLGALTGKDDADEKTIASEGRAETDYTKYLKAGSLTGKRIGVWKKSMGFSDKVDSLMNKSVAYMKAQGAEIIDVKLPPSSAYDDASFDVMLYEFRDGLNKYLAGLDSEAAKKTLAELIKFNIKDSVELKYFDQKIFIMAEKKGDINNPEYRKALEKMLKATRLNGIDKLMDSARLDAIIAPTGSPAWKTDLILGDHFVGGSSSPAAISGYPAITVPMGFIDELPVGITFFGRAWSESTLLGLAYSYEQGTKHRKAPKYLLTD
jgi:amidase